MKKSTLSVIMCNYNHAHYIGEALEAIFSQSFKPTEVIVVDDGSTDNSIEVIGGFAKEHPNLILLRNEKNMGVNYSVKRCLDAASCEYVVSASADDKILPGLFEKSMNILAQYPQAGLCCSDSDYVVNNKLIKGPRLHFSDHPSYFSPEDAVKYLQGESFTPILPHTAIIKRSALIEAGGFLPQLRWSCDTFAFHIIIFRNGFCYVPEVLTTVRCHPEQQGRIVTLKPHLEREVIKAAMDTLKTPKYSDVLPMFRRTAPFSSTPWQVLRVVITNRQHWDFFSFKVLRFGLTDLLFRWWLLRFLPPPLLNYIRKIVNIGRLLKNRIRGIYKMEGR